MNETRTLQVRTVGTGENRVKVVLFPGHEFGIEYFLPQNLLMVRKLSDNNRVIEVASKFKEGRRFLKVFKKKKRFISKIDRWHSSTSLNALSEARLGLAVNALRVPGVKVEQPLAAILRPNGHHQVIYRKITENEPVTDDHRQTIRELKEKLSQIGVSPTGTIQFFPGKNGTVHVYDLEEWGTRKEARKALKLKSPVRFGH